MYSGLNGTIICNSERKKFNHNYLDTYTCTYQSVNFNACHIFLIVHPIQVK